MTYDIAMGGYYYDNSHDFTNSFETYRLPQENESLKNI